MKVIFLDVDGVLNYTGSPTKLPHGYPFIEEDKILLLKQIIDMTGAKVVLSSDWRYGWIDPKHEWRNDYIALRDKLLEYGIELMDKTPMGIGIRGEEIFRWFKSWKGEHIESFVILDDRTDLEPFNHRLVITSMDTGLTKNDVKDAIRMLCIPFNYSQIK